MVMEYMDGETLCARLNVARCRWIRRFSLLARSPTHWTARIALE